MVNRLRVAWFSPLNLGSEPTQSLSAYVSDALLPFIGKRCEVELFHNGFISHPDFPTYHYLRAFERHREKPYDIFFYQVEDGQVSHFTRFHLGLVPGIVLFHDLFVTDSGAVPLYVSPWEETVKKFHDPLRSWPTRDQKFEHRAPILYRECGLSGIPIFSNERAHSEYKRNITEKLGDASQASYYLPYPACRGESLSQRSSEVFTLALCGSPRIEHRAHKVLNALSKLSAPFTLLWLIGNDEASQAEALLKEFCITSCELITGRSPEKWSSVVARADCALHPLFSAFGQPGPYLATSLTAGVPSLVTNFGAAEYLPDSVVFKIQPGENESFEILSVIEKLSKSRPRLKLAAEFAQEHFNPTIVAHELSLIFERSVQPLREMHTRWDALLGEAREDLLREARVFIEGTASCPNRGEELFGESGYQWNTLVEPSLKELGWSLK